MDTDEVTAGLLPALRRLREDGDGFDGGPVAARLGCFGAARLLRRGPALCDLGPYAESEAAHAAALSRCERIGEDYCAAHSRRSRGHPLDHAGPQAGDHRRAQEARAARRAAPRSVRPRTCQAGCHAFPTSQPAGTVGP